MSTDALRIGLPDVALLARVQRPPVTMWLRRYAGSPTPFPDHVAAQGTQHLYDAHAVVSWLESTGLGRNPDARADLAAFAALADHGESDSAFAGLTALLCLHRAAGSLPADPADLLDLADDTDPDDDHLYREIEALGDRLGPLARYAALLVDAAYHAGAAFETLMRRRTRRPHAGHARTALAPAARNLAASLAWELGAHAQEAPVFVDPGPGSSDLLVELAGLAGEGDPITVATPGGDGPEERLARRRLRAHGITRVPLAADDHGGVTVPDGAVLLLQLPAPGSPELTEVEVLRVIEDVVLGSSREHPTVVIAPSEALTDRVRGAAAVVRDAILRTDRVRGIVRLPPGLLPSRSRARLALWCLGPLPPAERPDGVHAEPRTVVADLAGLPLDAAAAAELVTDLLVGMQGVRALATHSPAFTRAVPTRTLRARTGDLVEPMPARRGVDPTADLIARIAELRAELAAPLAPAGVPDPIPRSTPAPPPMTLGDAERRRAVQVLPGLRLAPAHRDPAGSVRVIGPDQLAGGRPGPGVDRLVLAARYPATRFTEPGDVVFRTAPHPAALVDVDGGAVVAFPARVLRSRSTGLPPALLSAAVNAQPATAKAWRAWTVRPTPDDQAVALTAILDDLTRHRDTLSARLAAADQLASTLIDGVTAGRLTLTPA